MIANSMLELRWFYFIVLGVGSFHSLIFNCFDVVYFLFQKKKNTWKIKTVIEWRLLSKRNWNCRGCLLQKIISSWVKNRSWIEGSIWRIDWREKKYGVKKEMNKKKDCRVPENAFWSFTQTFKPFFINIYANTEIQMQEKNVFITICLMFCQAQRFFFLL